MRFRFKKCERVKTLDDEVCIVTEAIDDEDFFGYAVRYLTGKNKGTDWHFEESEVQEFTDRDVKRELGF